MCVSRCNFSRNVAKRRSLVYFSCNSNAAIFRLRDMLQRGSDTCAISSATCLATGSVALQVAEKIASCNSALKALQNESKADCYLIVRLLIKFEDNCFP